MFRILTIAHNTFTEVIRQPAYLVILGCAVLLILISPYITMFALLENLKMVKDMGLATLLMTGFFLAVFSSASVIYQEIENRTVLTVITKPIRRSSFIIGKFLGILLGILVAQYLLTLVTLQTGRTEITEAMYSDTDRPVIIGYSTAILLTILVGAYANFMYKRPFTSSAILCAFPAFTGVFLLLCFVNHKWGWQSFAIDLDGNIFIASFLIFLAVSLLTAIAVTASTRFSPIPTVAISIFFFLMGLFSDYLLGRYAEESKIMAGLYKIVPNLQLYLIADAVWRGSPVPYDYILYVLGYTVSFLIGILSLGIALFQERETQ